MKAVPLFALLIALAACAHKDEPTAHIYRHPAAKDAPTAGAAARSGPGVSADHRNHALTEPEDGQHRELQPGVFLLVDAAARPLDGAGALFRALNEKGDDQNSRSPPSCCQTV